MKKKTLIRRFSKIMAVTILAGSLMISGCAGGNTAEKDGGNVAEAQTNTEVGGSAGVDDSKNGAEKTIQGSGSLQAAYGSVTTLDVSDMFSKKDQETVYEESECVLISLNGDSATCESSAVSVEGSTVIIKEAGDYLLRGTLENGSIRIEAPEDAKVRLILDGVSISTDGTAGIYAKTADKVFVTLAENSANTVKNGGEFVAIDENNIDGAIFSKCDLTINGAGKLSVSSEKGHGIVSKDDLKVTGGTIEITAGGHGVSGKDSVRIADGTINVTSGEDGIHSGNDEDEDKGYVYIEGGNITISANDDGIHGESKVVIADGTINVTKSYEGIEGKVIEIAGGNVTVKASDDGLNVTDGSGTEFFGGFGGRGGNNDGNNEEVYILISGGKLVVDAGGDGLDSNGNLYVSGGETYVSGPENNGNGALDYNSKAELTGGVLIAVGSTGMAMNFSNSTQGCALLTLSSTHKAGEEVKLTDGKGNILISYVPTSSFSSVVVTCPDMKQGETYTLTVGSETKEFTLDNLIYGQSEGFGGMGGFGGPGRGQRPEGFGGNSEGMPSMPEGFGGNSEGMPSMPEGFDGNFEGMPSMPEGFDGNFEGMPNMPGGFDGNFEGGPDNSRNGKDRGGKGRKDNQQDSGNNT